jgi:hypothetical protein
MQSSTVSKWKLAPAIISGHLHIFKSLSLFSKHFHTFKALSLFSKRFYNFSKRFYFLSKPFYSNFLSVSQRLFIPIVSQRYLFSSSKNIIQLLISGCEAHNSLIML